MRTFPCTEFLQFVSVSPVELCCCKVRQMNGWVLLTGTTSSLSKKSDCKVLKFVTICGRILTTKTPYRSYIAEYAVTEGQC